MSSSFFFIPVRFNAANFLLPLLLSSSLVRSSPLPALFHFFSSSFILYLFFLLLFFIHSLSRLSSSLLHSFFISLPFFSSSFISSFPFLSMQSISFFRFSCLSLIRSSPLPVLSAFSLFLFLFFFLSFSLLLLYFPPSFSWSFVLLPRAVLRMSTTGQSTCLRICVTT